MNLIDCFSKHIDKERKIKQSTKTTPTVIPPDDIPKPITENFINDCFSQQENENYNFFFVDIFETIIQIHSYQTDKFITPS